MHVTDPYGREYDYDGEEVIVEAQLIEDQHANCYEAVGIPAPPFDPDQASHSIEPPGGHEAQRLRTYLCEQRIKHYSELTVACDPDRPLAPDLAALLDQLERVPVFPGELEQHADNASSPVPARPASARDAVRDLYDRLGSSVTGAYIEAAQVREADARRLIALAGERELSDDGLDEAVHDCGIGNPSQINNDGREAQIRHLLLHNSEVVTRRLIEQAVR